MEEQQYDFSSLFERSQGDYAGSILERLFGGIIPYLTGASDKLGAGNWLSTIFGLFNTAGLLAVLIVTSYTIYTVIMDTASDGKVFGQRTDTKYTIMRTMAGLIAFVPVSGGYSLAQVAVLFIVVQGSAMADVVWTRTADAALKGQPLLAQPVNDEGASNFVLQAQFATAFDTLVMGHLCAINANHISGISRGEREPDLDKPMEVYSSNVIRDESSGWNSPVGVIASATLHHVIRFQDTSGSAYGGRANFCGAVENEAIVRQSLPGTVSFADQVAQVRITAQFENYVSMINRLSSDARNLAMQIYDGLRDVREMEKASREAVRRAASSYVAGAATNFAFSDEETHNLHQGLLQEATERGWVFAPAWQRGISMGATWYGSPDGDLRLKAYPENNLVEYLSGAGIRTGWFADSTTSAMLAKATDDFETWDMMGPYLEQLSDPNSDVEEGSYSGLTRSDVNLNAILQWIYRSMLNLFSPATWGGDTGGYTDPMVQVTYQGKVLATAGTALAGAGLGGNIAAAAPGAFKWLPGVAGASEGVKIVSGWAITTGMAFLVAGFIIGTMVPMIPILYFYSAVLSWILLVVESMFAVPLAVLSLFAPAREGSLLGSWNKIILSIFGIFFRPFFTVVGMIFAMIVLAFSLKYLYDLFYILMEFLIPSQTLWNMLMMIGFVSVYVVVTITTVLLSAQLITELGDGALNWLGVTFGQLASRMNVGENAQISSQLGATGPLAQAASLASPNFKSAVSGASSRLTKIPRHSGPGLPRPRGGRRG